MQKRHTSAQMSVKGDADTQPSVNERSPGYGTESSVKSAYRWALSTFSEDVTLRTHKQPHESRCPDPLQLSHWDSQLQVI